MAQKGVMLAPFGVEGDEVRKVELFSFSSLLHSVTKMKEQGVYTVPAGPVELVDKQGQINLLDLGPKGTSGVGPWPATRLYHAC